MESNAKAKDVEQATRENRMAREKERSSTSKITKSMANDVEAGGVTSAGAGSGRCRIVKAEIGRGARSRGDGFEGRPA